MPLIDAIRLAIGLRLMSICARLLPRHMPETKMAARGLADAREEWEVRKSKGLTPFAY